MKLYKQNLTHYKLFSGEMAELIPLQCTEVIPGQILQGQTSVVLRFSPMAAPVMHPVSVRVHHFFVPHRIVWTGWEDFITGGEDGTDASTIPTITATGTLLEDYLGVLNSGSDYSALPVYGYNAIYNEWYRDQQIIPAVANTTNAVQKVAWEKDYFTTARPSKELGPEATVPIKGIGRTSQGYSTGPVLHYESNGESRNYDFYGASLQAEGTAASGGYPNVHATISDIREAAAIQRIKEARNMYGARYDEFLRWQGVNPRDGRLARPELVAAGKTNVNFSEVLQTGPEATTPHSTSNAFGVGDMYGPRS